VAVAAGWVDQGTGPEARDPVSGWAVVGVRAAGELVVAEPAAPVGQEQVPACGILVWPEAEVAEQGPAAAGEPGRVAEVELVVEGDLEVRPGVLE
jgi:hypothetical protein